MMNAQKSRTGALVAAASLAFGLTACTAGGTDTTGPQKTAARTDAATQTVDEACDTLVAEVSPAIAKMRAYSVVDPVGEIPDFAGIFGALEDGAKKAGESITNAEVSAPLAQVIDVAGKIRTALEGVDYSSVDPKAPDAIRQAQTLNNKALSAAGLDWEDFQKPIEAVIDVCPMPELSQ